VGRRFAEWRPFRASGRRAGPPPPPAEASDWLVGGGELGELIRAVDWSETSFGPRERWPGAMRAVVNLIVGSRFPMVLAWGRELLLLYNDAFREIAGEKHPRALGRSIREVWPEVWPISGPIFAAVMDRAETVYLEDKLFPIDRHGQREDAYFTLSYSPMRLEEGAVAGTLITLLETTRRVHQQQLLETERRRAEAAAEREHAALRESEERYRTLFERIDEGFCLIEVLFDPAGKAVDYRFLETNPAFERHTGLAGAKGKTAREVVPLLEASWFEAYGRIATTGVPERLEEESRAMGRWFDVYGFRIGRPEDRKVALLFNDITARKRAEEALRTSEEKFAKAFHGNATSMVIARIRDGVIIDVNDAYTGTSGYGRDEAVGKSILRLWEHHEDREAFIRDLRRDGAVRNYEARVVNKSGESRVGLISAQVISIQGELAIIASMLDITERKRAEEALRQANARLREIDQRKNDFLAMLSHELRNPLAPIRNSVYVLERASPGGEQAKRARQVIDRQAQHLTRLVEDLLDVTRISRGKINLQRERVDLDALARGTAEDHREVFARSGVELDVEAPGEPLWVEGDPTRLAQVIGNLLNNSAKFTPRGGTAVLSVEANGRGEAVIRVRDDGAGMSPQTLEHLFEPFEQAAQTLERSRGGLGLGLALVKGLVELHGGSVAAHSEGEGKGSELTVTLPLKSPAKPKRAAVPTPKRSASARRVLVIEDNVDAAESLREALELGDHDVAIAQSGPEGVEAARRFHPDVVLCDIGLPGLDGYGVARALRSDPDPRLRSMFLVALSGYALDEDVTKSREAGFDRHIAKPPSVEALEKLLAETPARAAAGESLGEGDSHPAP